MLNVFVLSQSQSLFVILVAGYLANAVFTVIAMLKEHPVITAFESSPDAAGMWLYLKRKLVLTETVLWKWEAFFHSLVPKSISFG